MFFFVMSMLTHTFVIYNKLFYIENNNTTECRYYRCSCWRGYFLWVSKKFVWTTSILIWAAHPDFYLIRKCIYAKCVYAKQSELLLILPERFFLRSGSYHFPTSLHKNALFQRRITIDSWISLKEFVLPFICSNWFSEFCITYLLI